MAEAILGSNAPLRKSQSPLLNMSTADTLALPGLVQHPLLCPDTQLTLLAEVDKTGSANLAALVAALPSHPRPATAALALVAAGVLAIEPGLIDAGSRLRRAKSDTVSATTRSQASTTNAVTESRIDLVPSHPDNATSKGEIRTLRSTKALPGYHDPQIFFASGARRALLGRQPQLRQPGIYLGTLAPWANVGTGSDVGKRVSKGAHLSMLGADDTIFAVIDRNDRLAVGDARVAERLLAQAVEAQGEFKLRNMMPKGEAVDSATYGRIFAFVSEAIQMLREARLAFTSGAGIALFDGEPVEATLDPQEDADVPGQSYELRSCGLLARAVNRNGEWIVLKGSEIRVEVQPSAHGSASQRRAELLHSGGLVSEGDRYRLTQDLRFGSATGAGHFVVGCKIRPDIWRLSANDEPPAPLPRR